MKNVPVKEMQILIKLKYTCEPGVPKTGSRPLQRGREEPRELVWVEFCHSDFDCVFKVILWTKNTTQLFLFSTQRAEMSMLY